MIRRRQETRHRLRAEISLEVCGASIYSDFLAPVSFFRFR